MAIDPVVVVAAAVLLLFYIGYLHSITPSDPLIWYWLDQRLRSADAEGGEEAGSDGE